MKHPLTHLISAITLLISAPSMSQAIEELNSSDCYKLDNPKTAVYIYPFDDQQVSAFYQKQADELEGQGWTFFKTYAKEYAPMTETSLETDATLLGSNRYNVSDYMGICGKKLPYYPGIVVNKEDGTRVEVSSDLPEEELETLFKGK